MKKANAAHRLPIAIVCRDKDNDLAAALMKSYEGIHRYETVADMLKATESTPPFCGVMLLADGYPTTETALSEEAAACLRRAGIRLYIEYPAKNRTLGINACEGTEGMGYSRAVVTNGNALGLPRHSLLYVHGAIYQKHPNAEAPLLVCATVAGYDTAVFGLADCRADALLFKNSAGDTLIAATKLSQFISARYAPFCRIGALWRAILTFLAGDEVPPFTWVPSVRPRFSPRSRPGKDAYRDAVRLNSEWYLRSGILPKEDGSAGIYEGFSSGNKFDAYGRQEKRTLLRADCNGESIGALALASRLLGDERYGDVAHRAMRWLLCESPLSQGERADKADPQYGLLSWHDLAYDQYYGDDNAKAILGLLLAAASLGTREFDCRILEAIVGNFRTTGANGFRGARLTAEILKKSGWRHFYTDTPVNYSAHFEALPWACYLWAYDRTGYAPFLTRTEKGIAMMMAAYDRTLSEEVTDRALQWRWANGLQQERAKMILPLAWLVRLSPTDTHIAWLDRMITDLVRHQDPHTGALADAFGKPGEGYGLYGPFTENAQYGKHESPVIQENGDPCSDSLYTASFAMMTLHEAEAAMRAIGKETYAARYRTALRALSDYHVRIQEISDDPAYHGVWFRGFDFRKWEVYGSDGDAGWGVFCIETGWSQSWISAALSLQEMETSIWDLTRTTTVAAHAPAVIRSMLEEMA